jgi:hypothetical protein
MMPEIGLGVKRILEEGTRVKDIVIKITVRGQPKLDWKGTALQNRSWNERTRRLVPEKIGMTTSLLELCRLLCRPREPTE